MRCPLCRNRLVIARVYETKDNNIDYVNYDYVCINEKCSGYAGTDLSEPRAVITTETVKKD